MILRLTGHRFHYEVECLVRLFFPGEVIRVVKSGEQAGITPPGEYLIIAGLRRVGSGHRAWCRVRLGGKPLRAADAFLSPDDAFLWEAERRICVLLFELLCKATATRPPWGILTGVRPVNLCRNLIAGKWKTENSGENGGPNDVASLEAARKTLLGEYLVEPRKAALALETMQAQRDILAGNTPESYSLYISIPFCPTRCLYCSFVSQGIDRAGKHIPEYVALLCRELEETGALAARLGLRLRSVYVGGGTPTSLSPPLLRKLCGQLAAFFPLASAEEFTVEAGRPDSITEEKLAALREYGVTRISVNPQTMDDALLAVIGRNHTAAQVTKAMALARSMGFQNINMDLIAGLPGQTPASFADSLEQVLAMSAESITVHTLTVKRSSALRARPDAFEKGRYDMAELLEPAQARLRETGYHPYYLYRQQGTPWGHENTGFCKRGCAGLYNIYSMEDAHTIFAAGAGGVTKLVEQPDRMKRIFNYKYPYEYIAGFGEILARKGKAEEFYRQRKAE